MQYQCSIEAPRQSFKEQPWINRNFSTNYRLVILPLGSIDQIF